MTNKTVIAFTGQLASGKGTATKYLVERYNAVSVRFSDSLRDILDRMYVPHERAPLQTLSLALRTHFGQDVLSKIVAHDVTAADADVVIVDGVRRPLDIQYLRELPNFTLIAIAAPQRTRFERMRGRSENIDDASKTWEQFQIDETADAEVLIPTVMADADMTVDNSGTQEELYRQLDEIGKRLGV